MAFGDGQPQEINAGIAAQPLVTSPDRSITDQSAVDRLAEAFRQGFITTQDIQQNIGMVGPRKKAELQKLSEFVNPEVVGSRMAQARAMGAQADLASAQAAAEAPLVEQAAALKKEQMDREKENIWNAEALKIYQDRGQPVIYKPDGTKDTEKMAYRGRLLLDANNRMQFAQSMLAGKWSPEKRGDGFEHNVMRNSLGEDVTPVPNKSGQESNPNVKHYQQMKRDAQKALFESHWEPTDQDVGRPAPAEGAEVTPRASVAASDQGMIPAPPVSPEKRAALANALTKSNFPDAVKMAGQMTDQDVANYEAQNGPLMQVKPAAPTQKVTINPDGSTTIEHGAAPEVEPYIPGTGRMTPEAGYFHKPEEISSALATRPEIVEWGKAKDAMNRFSSSAGVKVPSARTDADLLTSVAQIVNAGTDGATADVTKLNLDKPVMEKLRNWQAQAFGTKLMPDEARARLVESGMRAIRAREASVRPALELALKRWESMNPGVKEANPLETVLDPGEIAIARHGSMFANVQAPGSRPALPPGAVAGTQGGRAGYKLNGQFYAYKGQ